MNPATSTIDIEHAFRTHGHQVQRRATQMLGNDDEAGEILQEVFALLLERPTSYRGQSTLSTWLYGVTTRLCLNHIKKQRNRQRLRNLFLRRKTPSTDSLEQRTMVRQILEQVPFELAEIATYHYLDEMSQAEIATMVGCSRRTVGHRLEQFQHRAKRWQEQV